MKKTSKIPVPKFTSEDEEREFWATADSTKYIDWHKAERTIFPDLKPSVRAISLRLPELLIANVKVLANKRDVPYQTLMKTYLSERVEKEMRSVHDQGVPVRMREDGKRLVANKMASRGEVHLKASKDIKIKAGKAPRMKAGKPQKKTANK